MTATEIMKIIKACNKHGVSEFCLDGLKLSFGTKLEAVPSAPLSVQIEENPEFAKSILEQREYELKQQRLDEMRLADPYTYEQMICRDKDDEEPSIGAQ